MQRHIIFQMQPFNSLLQCQVGIVFKLNITYSEPLPISSPIMLYQTHFGFSWLVGSWVIPPLKYLIKPMASCIDYWWLQQFTWFLNHGFVIFPFSYWFPHVIINISTFQIHFMLVLHACGLLGVLNMLYSQCYGMIAWRLNCSYRCKWNGALHCGHLLLTIIKVIKHCGWYMGWKHG
jgi:hypothetical protein